MDSKDIRFSEKKVDESWKDQAAKDRVVSEAGVKPVSSSPSLPPASSGAEDMRPKETTKKTSKAFVELLSSLGYQAMFHLGEIPDPRTGQSEVNLEGAKEAIDLLLAIKEKSVNNLSIEETQILQQILPELQIKFSQKA